MEVKQLTPSEREDIQQKKQEEAMALTAVGYPVAPGKVRRTTRKVAQ